MAFRPNQMFAANEVPHIADTGPHTAGPTLFWFRCTGKRGIGNGEHKRISERKGKVKGDRSMTVQCSSAVSPEPWLLA